MRSAFGIATLVLSASCVAHGNSEGNTSQRQVLSIEVPPPAPPLVVPAGPSAALLEQAALLSPESGFDDEAGAPPFIANAAPADARRALDCLTQAVYYEARSESEGGQEAVAQVVLNRVRHPAFPNSVCGTVFEGASRRNRCQFSFACDGSLAARREPSAWARAEQVASAALAGAVYAPVGSATYYHTSAVHPGWSDRVTKITEIGAHLFYRLPGALGDSLAFRQRYGGVEPSASAGIRFPEKPIDQIVAEIQASVKIHRGSDSDLADLAPQDDVVSEAPTPAAPPPPPPSRVAGVRIHRGIDAASISDASNSGVTIHVQHGSDSKAPIPVK